VHILHDVYLCGSIVPHNLRQEPALRHDVLHQQLPRDTRNCFVTDIAWQANQASPESNRGGNRGGGGVTQGLGARALDKSAGRKPDDAAGLGTGCAFATTSGASCFGAVSFGRNPNHRIYKTFMCPL